MMSEASEINHHRCGVMMFYGLRWPGQKRADEKARKLRMATLDASIKRTYEDELARIGPNSTEADRNQAYARAAGENQLESNEYEMLDQLPLLRKAAFWDVPVEDDLWENGPGSTFHRVLTRRGQQSLRESVKAEREKRIEWWGKLVIPCAALILSIFNLIAGPLQTLGNYQRDSRAWIELDPIKLVLISGPKEVTELEPLMEGQQQIFTVELVPRNIGKTEARNISYRFSSTRGTADLGRNKSEIEELVANHSSGTSRDGKNPYPDFLLTSAPILAPNSTGLLSYPVFLDAPYFSGQRPNLSYSQEYVFGRIEYQDVSGRGHWMTFCFTLGSYKLVTYCEYGNDEDRR